MDYSHGVVCVLPLPKPPSAVTPTGAQNKDHYSEDLGELFYQEIPFFKIFYLFIHERHTKRGRDTGRGRSRILVVSLLQDSVPGPWDQDLSRRQTLSHPGAPRIGS